MLGPSLDVTERVSVGNAVCAHVDAAICGIRKITGIERRLKGSPQERTRHLQRLSPVSDVDGEHQIDASLEATEPTLLYQIQS